MFLGVKEFDAVIDDMHLFFIDIKIFQQIMLRILTNRNNRIRSLQRNSLKGNTVGLWKISEIIGVVISNHQRLIA